MTKRGPTPIRRPQYHWYAPDGTRARAGTPGAKQVRRLSDTYSAKIGGKWVSLETTDLGEAWTRLRSGKYPRAKPPTPAPTLDTHLAAFLDSLRHAGVSAKQVGEVGSHVRLLASLASWRQVGHLSPESLQSALAHLGRQGKSAQTRKHYFRHAYQFARWCVPRLLPHNPFAGLSPPGTSTDRRHDRRCPSDAEMEKLWNYLTGPGCRIRRGMTGRQRMLGYQVSMATGFRADELRSLTRESFDLPGGTVTLAAAADKRRKATVQPIPTWLAEDLRTWFAQGGETWDRFPSFWPGRILKADLAAAGVPYAVPGPDGPLYFDFHSLRVWYITQLANQPGISPKTLMELARHSDPRLTLKVYAKAKTAEARAAAEQIPPPGKK